MFSTDPVQHLVQVAAFYLSHGNCSAAAGLLPAIGHHYHQVGHQPTSSTTHGLCMHARMSTINQLGANAFAMQPGCHAAVPFTKRPVYVCSEPN